MEHAIYSHNNNSLIYKCPVDGSSYSAFEGEKTCMVCEAELVRILSRREFTKERVKKWEGIRNSDTGQIEGGYLFMVMDDGHIVGKSTMQSRKQIANRAQAIDYFYSIYLREIEAAYPDRGIA